jgi:hypothetical protein
MMKYIVKRTSIGVAMTRVIFKYKDPAQASLRISRIAIVNDNKE